ncbi:uncharacterized protein LOC129593023 isoform X2 [Paramacrobiotus metropolitanus]|uniref:uncharacterized protein LOC129593023 isoform X2 n=1 Tax=Paramacrobiotus metropolitanus TaxID=2943436 RepID=UPI002445710A|nr:uncharacterized protein LOC129593023 isoform X2 [Paramacrobiotus metropolitanus]
MLHPCEIIAIVWVFRYTYADSTVPSAFANAVPAGLGHTTGATKPQNKVTSANLDNFVAVEYKPSSSDIKDIQHVALIPGESGNGTLPFNASCPAMVSRAEWHARDPVYNNQTAVKTFLQYPLRYMVYTQTLTGTTVHGTCTDRESCKKTVKAIQDDHMGFSPSSTTKFADIAYKLTRLG